jgi:two-component system, LuxR family, sensor histidine kinase DctS
MENYAPILIATGILIIALMVWRRSRVSLREARTHRDIMSAVVAQSPAVVGITDVEGNITYANPAFQKQTGFSMDELLGQNPRMLKSGIMPEEVYSDLWQTITNDGVWTGELCNKRKNGDLYWEKATIGAIRSRGAEITHFVKVSEDITDRKKLDAARTASELRFRSIFDHAGMGIAIVDRQGHWQAVNECLCEMLGYGKSELLGHSFLDVTPEEDHHLEKDWSTAFGGIRATSLAIEKRFKHKSGHIVWAEVTGSLVRDDIGAPEYFICMIKDLTRRRKAEEIAATRQMELAHLSRIHTLQQMTSELAHEIDQPLCAILSAAQAGVRLFNGQNVEPEELNKVLALVVEQAERAGAVVRRIKNFSRKNEPEMRVFDMFAALDDARALLGAEMDGRQVECLLDSGVTEDCPVVGDPILVEQVLVNLFRNAAESMVEAGVSDPQIKITVVRKEGQVQTTVKDNGPPIEEGIRKVIFTPFFTTRDQGLGIGLSLCSSIIDSHGGQLWLEDDDLQGNTFCFTLPAAD